MEIKSRLHLNSNKRTEYSATFHGEDGDFAAIEIVDPMVQMVEPGVVDHDVKPMRHAFTVTPTRDGKLYCEVLFNYADEDEQQQSSSLIEIPLPQIQELFDWLKQHKYIR